MFGENSEGVRVIIRFQLIGVSAVVALLLGCTNHSTVVGEEPISLKQAVTVPSSFLANMDESSEEVPALLSEEGQLVREGGAVTDNAGTQVLSPIAWPQAEARDTTILSNFFSEQGAIEVTAEKMLLRDFVHYTFGELLRVNYVLDETISGDTKGKEGDITLNLIDPVSPRILFGLITDILAKRDINIVHGSDTFYISKPDSNVAERPVIGVGREKKDVPDTVQRILQVVPLEYGIKLSVERTLRGLIKAKITPDFEQSVLFLEGDRTEILHALELVDLLDTPSTRSQHVALIGLDFLAPEVFARDVALLLENEGILTAIGKPAKRNVAIVPLQQLGAVAVFAVTEQLLGRVQQWAGLIDVPGEGSSEQYFLYHPKNARAKDLGDSVSKLLGFGSVGDREIGQVSSEATTGSAPSASRVSGVNLKDLKMVVDERANALIFFTTGSQYRGLLPLMEKLDIMPLQVLLDITIAEVSLKDEFKYGVEWAVSRGEVALTTQGAFGVSTIGGLGVVINGTEGPLDASFLDTNSLVNVLSKPSLLVRDGVSATIKVGSDISVVGATTQDPISGERQTTTSEYRKTGVNVTVTPTVNGRGIVVMEIDQTISNSVPSSSGASGNPDIFERSLKTELLANTGQTVMMAGLISETSSKGGSGTPLFSKIPLLGGLFKATSNSNDRTELVMLITPRVIDGFDRWDEIMGEFKESLKYLELPVSK